MLFWVLPSFFQTLYWRKESKSDFWWYWVSDSSQESPDLHRYLQGYFSPLKLTSRAHQIRYSFWSDRKRGWYLHILWDQRPNFDYRLILARFFHNHLSLDLPQKSSYTYHYSHALGHALAKYRSWKSNYYQLCLLGKQSWAYRAPERFVSLGRSWVSWYPKHFDEWYDHKWRTHHQASSEHHHSILSHLLQGLHSRFDSPEL